MMYALYNIIKHILPLSFMAHNINNNISCFNNSSFIPLMKIKPVNQENHYRNVYLEWQVNRFMVLDWLIDCFKLWW